MQNANLPSARRNGVSTLLVAVLLALVLPGGLYYFLSGEDAAAPGESVTADPVAGADTPRRAGGDRFARESARRGNDAVQSPGAERWHDPDFDEPDPWALADRLADRARSSADRVPVRAAARSLPDPAGEDALWLPEEVYRDPYAIAGRVLDDAGEPVRGATVRAEPRNDRDAAPSSVSTDASGFYVFDSLDAETWLVSVDATYDYDGVSKVVSRGVHSADFVVTRKAGDLWVEGRVRDERGVPLEGVEVLQGDRPSYRARSDAAGGFTLDLAPQHGRERYRLALRHDGYRDAYAEVSVAALREPGTPPLDVRMEPVEEVTEASGTVLDTAGNPVAGELVQLVSLGLGKVFYDRTDDNGRFTIGDVIVAPDYVIKVQPGEPWLDFSRKVTVPESGLRTDITLRRRESGAIEGLIVDAAGSPVPGLSLTARSLSATHQAVTFTSDGAGHFYLDDVPAGDLVFESRAYPSVTVRGVRVAADETTEVLLVVDWGDHRLFGQVLDPGGIPVPGGRVEVAMEYRNGTLFIRSSRTTVADATGTFTFAGLGPGTHAIRVDADGRETKVVEYDVQAAMERVDVLID